jgi:hypothetical protein
MRSLAAALPGLGSGLPIRAIWPVWRNSTTKPVAWQPMSKHDAAKTWQAARRFERQTRRPGRQDGVLGRNGLTTLNSLLFDFTDFTSGALFPSHAAIADKACISLRSVARGLESLKAAGIIDWTRRCEQSFENGRFVLRQLSNAYTILNPAKWIGFKAKEPRRAPPPPERGTWGDPEPCNALDLAAAAVRTGAGQEERFGLMEIDPSDRLATALARLGKLVNGVGCACKIFNELPDCQPGNVSNTPSSFVGVEACKSR